MNKSDKTREQLLKELEKSNKKIVELEKSEAKHKQIEKMLDQKMREMEIFINNIPHMAWLKDSDSNFILANQKFGNVVGMDPEYLRNHTCAVCFGEEAAQKFKADDRKVMERKKQITLVETIVDTDGNRIYLETTKSPIFNDTRDVVGTVGIAVDITMRKQAEDELRQYRERLEDMVEDRTSELQQEITERKQAQEEINNSEKKFKILTESAPIGIYYNDLNGTFLYGNKKAEEIIGYKLNELIGKNFLKLKLLDPKHILKAAKLLALNKLGKSTGPDYFKLNTKDGGQKQVEISTRIINIEERKVVLGMVQDITERKQAEEELRISHENTKTILRKAPIGVIIIGRDRKIKMINETALKMAGVENADIILGKNCGEYLCPSQQKDCPILDRAQQVDNSERIFRNKDGKEIPIIKTVTEINLDGEDVLLETFIDITERKQAEEELKQKMKQLERFNKVAVDRELRMIELKREINDLLEKAGLEKKYSSPD